MQPDNRERMVHPLPPVLWVLGALIVLPEIAFMLGSVGLAGAPGPAMRMNAVQMTAWIPELITRGWPGAIRFDQLYRMLAYAFVTLSPFNTLFVLAFTLALGKAISAVFNQWAVAALFLGSAIGGALVYTAFSVLPGTLHPPLIGGYPAAYGLIGAFTWVLWMRMRAVGEHPARAFMLIGALALFQIVFAIINRYLPPDWIADFAGFGCGFFLSFVLTPGGLRRLRQR